MPTVINVDSGDGIAEVINRVRAATGADEVALVIPDGARLLHEGVNLRLLKQFSRSSARRTAIVSGDSRIQHVAAAAGFATYASVPAYERDIELVRPHPGDDGAAPLSAGNAADAAVAGHAVAAAGGTATATRIAPAPAPSFQVPGTPLAAGSRTAAASRIGAAGDSKPHRPHTVAAIAAAVVGVFLLVLIIPSAAVTITLAADPITVNSTIVGSADSTQAGRPDSLVTTVVSDDQSAQFQATPTGSQTVPAVAATGSVSIVSDLPYFAAVDVPKGEEFDTTDAVPVKFFAIEDTKICIPGAGVACPIDGSQGGPDLVRVADGTGEARGNVQPGAIKGWPQNPCTPQPNVYSCAPSDLQVTNSFPATGGTDEKKLVIASAPDVQTMSNQSNDLQTQLNAKVLQDMQAKAGSQVAAQDPSNSGRTMTCAVTPPLPKPNDPFAPTGVTVACHGKEAVYNPKDAIAIITRDLQAKVPQGDQLAADCQMPPPMVTLAADDGRVILSASGNCFAQPMIDIDGLRGQFAGKSADTVSKLTRTRVGAQVVGVTVTQHPVGLPWLPMFSSRIDLAVKVVAKTTTTT